MTGVTRSVFEMSRTRQQNSGIEFDPVTYEPGEDKQAVVRRFIDENPEMLTEMGRIGAVTEQFGNVGEEWAEAWKAVEPTIEHELENSGAQTGPDGTTCPFCGGEFDYLPFHLPCPRQ